ncbi:MAG: YciI family protein, partial [Acidimicrobiales bacterium]
VSTKRYLLFVCVGEDVQLTPEESQRMGPATDHWIATAEEKDARLFGNQLEPVSVARTVRVRGGEVMVTDGPFAETKEQIAGFDILECPDLDEALDLAALHPVARIGAMEVRPLWSFDEA